MCFFSSFVFTWWRGKSLWGGLLATWTGVRRRGLEQWINYWKKRERHWAQVAKYDGGEGFNEPCKRNSKDPPECLCESKPTPNELFVRIPSVFRSSSHLSSNSSSWSHRSLHLCVSYLENSNFNARSGRKKENKCNSGPNCILFPEIICYMQIGNGRPKCRWQMVKWDTYNNKHLYHSVGEWENLYGTISGSYRSEMHGCTNCWNMNVFIIDSSKWGNL